MSAAGVSGRAVCPEGGSPGLTRLGYVVAQNFCNSKIDHYTPFRRPQSRGQFNFNVARRNSFTTTSGAPRPISRGRSRMITSRLLRKLGARPMVESDESRGHAGLWFASPLLLALVGLVGTGVGAVLQGFWNTRLEREKFEFSLIQKALDTADKNEAGRNLKFLVDAGLISQFDAKKIEALASTPDKLPSFLGAPSVGAACQTGSCVSWYV